VEARAGAAVTAAEIELAGAARGIQGTSSLNPGTVVYTVELPAAASYGDDRCYRPRCTMAELRLADFERAPGRRIGACGEPPRARLIASALRKRVRRAARRAASLPASP